MTEIWILAGQSNMEGLGWEDDPQLNNAVDPRTAVLTMSGEWGDATEPLHPLWESYTPVHARLMRPGIPVEDQALTDVELAHKSRGRRLGAGLGPAFASRLADLSGAPLGLVPAAHGGTTLEQWKRGFEGEAADSTATLYGSLLDRVRLALQKPGARLAGMLWYQGESDATAMRSHDYGDRLAVFIADVRRDLGDESLPVLLVQLGRFTAPIAGGEIDERSWDRIREAQRLLPGSVSHTATVSAVDLGLTDAIHVGTAGLRRLGRRLAEVAHGDLRAPQPERVELIEPTAHGLQRVRLWCSGVSGAWAPASAMSGFVLCDVDGVPIDRLRVVDAAPAVGHPGAIDIVTSTTSTIELAGISLGYGQGFDPVCRAVDERDLPLPTFRAIAVEAAR